MADEAQFQQVAQTQEDAGNASYWKHPQYSLIVKVVHGVNGALSASIHTINPEDKGARQLMTEMTEDAPKSKFIKMLTSADPRGLLELCGYSTDMKMTATEQNKWSGEVTIKEVGRTIGLNIDMSDPNTMKLEAFEPGLSMITKDTELKRVNTPPAACMRP